MRTVKTLCSAPLFVILSVLLANGLYAQNVGINNTGAAANASSMLDVSSTTKGLLIPRMTLAQRTAVIMNPLPTAAQGLLVYQTDAVEGFYYNTSITTTPNWMYINSGGTKWNQLQNPIDNLNLAHGANATIFTFNGVTASTAFSMSSNSLTSGSVLDLSSSSPAGIGGGQSSILSISKSGANTNASLTSTGIYSSVINTGTTNINMGAYFYASGATTNYGVYALTDAIGGYGVYGASNGPTGGGAGVYGTTIANNSYGVYGVNSSFAGGSHYGVYGLSNGGGITSFGYGVKGVSSGTASYNYGGDFSASAASNNYGINAVVSSGGANNYGGNFFASGGVSNYGVYSSTDAPGGYGVYGASTAPNGGGAGVYGTTSANYAYGVYGGSTASAAGDHYGIYGISSAGNSTSHGYGVKGIASGGGSENHGGDFIASGTQLNYGVYARASGSGNRNYGGSFDANGAGNDNYGIQVSATGTGTNNYGGYFTASGATNNYAGIFDQGNVGIGTLTPLYKLQVMTSGTYGAILGYNNGASGDAGSFQIINASNGNPALESYTSGSGQAAAFNINNAVNSSIAISGFTNGTGRSAYFEINNAANTSAAITGFTSGPGIAGQFSNISITASSTRYGMYSTVTGTGTSTNNIAGYFSSTNATNNYAAIFDQGNVGIGTTTPTYKLQVSAGNSPNGVALFQNTFGTIADGIYIKAGDNVTVGSYFTWFFRPDGAAIGRIEQTSTNGVTYNTTSDKRLKNIIGESHKGITDLMKIKIYDYTFKSDNNNKVQTGFMAQELYEIFPQSVSKPRDNNEPANKNPWMVDYGSVTPLIIKGVQDQQMIIQDQQKVIDKQQQQINDLVNRMNTLEKLVSEK